MLLPLLSVVLGAGITYWINVRGRRRTYREDLTNDAIARLAVAGMSVDYISDVGRPENQSDEDYAELKRWLVMESMKSWATKVAEANEAVARVVPYRPELAELLPIAFDITHREDHRKVIAMLRTSIKTPARRGM